MAVRFTGKKTQLDLESLQLSIPEGERRMLDVSTDLFSVEYVEVVNNQRQDGVCSIYGEISFSNKVSGPFFTPFKRSQNDPETIDLGDPNFRFLTLSDDGVQAPPIISSEYAIYVILKLFEKKPPQPESRVDQSVDYVEDQSSSPQKNLKVIEEINPIPETENLKGGDTCIAKIESRFDDFDDFNRRFIYEFKGNSGFVFYVAHAFMMGCVPVGIRFTINAIPSEEGQGLGLSSAAASDGQGQGLTSTIDGQGQGLSSTIDGQGQRLSSTGKRSRSHIGIYGIIAAVQQLCPSPCPAIQLFYRSDDEPLEEVRVGSPIRLDRTFLVAPVTSGYLYIGYTLYCAENDTLIATGIVPFPINANGLFFFTDKNLTHTRTSEDNRVSITMKFMAPLEATDPSGPPTLMKRIQDYDKFYWMDSQASSS